MIIENTANQIYRVTETSDVNLAHVWYGIEVKKVKGEWVPKAKARNQLVSKAHLHRIIER
jgi:hypothetical protein